MSALLFRIVITDWRMTIAGGGEEFLLSIVQYCFDGKRIEERRP